jgi:hypothetical protein
MAMRGGNGCRILMAVEAFFSNFYVAITRNLFIPMLTYQNYSLYLIFYVNLAAALLSILISYLIYVRSSLVSSSVRFRLLIMHVCERVLWMILPFIVGFPNLLLVMYALSQAIAIPVSILMNLAVFLSFRNEELIDVNILRSAVGSAASILGSLFIVYTTATVKAPDSYYISYVSGALMGLVASLSLLLYPSSALRYSIHQDGLRSEDVEVRRVNIFIMLIFSLAGANLVGLGWPSLLKKMDTPLYLVTALSLAGSFGGIIGPYLWRGFKKYVYAMAINSVTTLLIFFTPWPPAHLGYSAILSMSFVGFNFIALSIYSKYIVSLGVVEASTLLAVANPIGLLIASLTGMYIDNLLLIFLLASIYKLSALTISLLAIPESAIIPVKTAYGYGRLIYSIGVIGYTFTMETSRQAIRLTLQILALTTLITALYLIYRLANILV